MPDTPTPLGQVDLTPRQVVERAFALGGDGDTFCIPWTFLRDAAQTAALAYEYAIKAAAGTANDLDLGTLTSHCYVLANDLYDWTTEPPDAE